jgi:hypothetical protein
MKYKIGEKVVFLKKYHEEDAWPLIDYEEYQISDKSFDSMGIEIFYGVKHKNGTRTTWYNEMDFIGLKEYRKLKLKKINGEVGF